MRAATYSPMCLAHVEAGGRAGCYLDLSGYGRFRGGCLTTLPGEGRGARTKEGLGTDPRAVRAGPHGGWG